MINFTSRFVYRFAVYIALATLATGCNLPGQSTNPAPQASQSSPPPATRSAGPQKPPPSPVNPAAQPTAPPAPQLPSPPSPSGQPAAVSGNWFLQPGLLSVPNGLWVHFSLTFLALAGAAAWQWRQERLFSRKILEAKEYKSTNQHSAIEDCKKKLGEQSNQIQEINSSLYRLHASHADLKATLSRNPSATTAAPPSASFPSLNQTPPSIGFDSYPQTQPLYFQPTSPQPLPSQVVPPQPTAAQQQQEITDAINRGDRNRIRSQIGAQLNITSESESAIQVGRDVNTQLEEVPGGGSYLLISIGDEPLLYPTDQTLKGYLHSQPTKGIFNYEKYQVAAPQVLAPARLARNGPGWQVIAMGTIAVPG